MDLLDIGDRSNSLRDSLKAHPLYSVLLELWKMRDDMSVSVEMEELAIGLELVHELFDKINVTWALGHCETPTLHDKSVISAVVILAHQIVDICQSRRLYQEKCNRHRTVFEEASNENTLQSKFEVKYIGEKQSIRFDLLQVEFVVTKKNQKQASVDTEWQPQCPITSQPEQNTPNNVTNAIEEDKPQKYNIPGIDEDSLSDCTTLTDDVDNDPSFEEIVNSPKSKSPDNSDEEWAQTKEVKNARRAASRSDSKLAKRTYSRPNYPPEVTKVLREWLENNRSHPYPTEPEKRVMCSDLGLNLTQLNNVHRLTQWFINARRRYLPKASKQSSGVSKKSCI